MKPSLSTLVGTQREAERLAALRHYDVLDTPPDGTFDKITQLVSELLEVPIAIVSLVDHDRIWFASRYGLDAAQVDRDPGLCASAILGQGLYEVADASLDPRTLSNPLVAGELGVRFYAGHPLTTPQGHDLGVLCAMDFKPREVTDRDRHLLTTLAGVVMDHMNLRLAARQVDRLNNELSRVHQKLEHQVMHDQLTGLWNRGAVLAFLAQSLKRSQRSTHPVTALVVDVDLFKELNDTHGHNAGDQVLVELARRISQTIRTSDAAGRIGGEEFLVVLDEADGDAAVLVAERIRRAISNEPVLVQTRNGEVSLQVTASVGAYCNERCTDLATHHVLSRADAALYRAKRNGRNRVEAA